MVSKISALLTFILLGLLLVLLAIPVGPLPPAGAFFHPSDGFWANAETSLETGELNLKTPKINQGTEVYFDKRGVPHIFAENDYDLYFAQGYVTARDRLFQMELQVRAAGGTLAEWLGDDLVDYDMNQRRLGMIYGAEQAMKEIEKNDTIHNAIRAYADGINAYIHTLDPNSYPLEYKILDIEPAEWKPVNTALLLKYMTQMLAARSEDVRTSNTMAHLGEEFVDQFLSARPDLMDPIIPPETKWEINPKSTDSPDELYQSTVTDNIELWQPHPYNGSNNWAVDGSKTAGGYPMLSNDMHLNMSMPSIWYEIQLQAPGLNVYGVSLQGAPTVIVGYNEQIAWGATNTGADVMDWYEITFRDKEKTHYLHDGEWLPVEKRVETIRTKSGKVVQDTLLFTHHGPVYETREEVPPTQTIQHDHALKWVAHEPSNELLTFYKLNRGKNYEDFKEAFRFYEAPAQNVNFASTDGDIAIQTGGKLPVKWDFQGRTVSDGSDSRYDWEGFIPYDQNPHALNPERGFLSAANQYPTDETYPYYLGESFAPYERGRRINDRLREMDGITVTDFKNLLMDSFSYHAYHVLPLMLQELDRSDFDERNSDLYDRLTHWNYMNLGEEVAPSIFREWWSELYRGIWDNKYETEYPMRKPDRDITAELIMNDPGSPWFDNPGTDHEETFSDLVTPAFHRAVSSLTDRLGPQVAEWKWGYYNRTDLNHLGQIPGMGASNLFTDGSNESVNAVWGSHGPSWRMVVELDPDGVRGYGVYPGGQSGNPGSKTYDQFIETWRTGELFELLFLKDKPEQNNDFPLVIRFENAQVR